MDGTNPELRIRQELVNSLIHGFGIVFGLICIPILITQAVKYGSFAGTVGAAIYGFSFLMLFTFSTLYHSLQQERIKKLMKIFDHISIYFLISGTYTPFLLIYMNNNLGITLLVLLWGLTLAGTIFKYFFTGRWEIFSVLIYLAMGWIMLVAGRTFFENMPTSVIALIMTGAGLYTLGVSFYIWEKHVYSHAVWHSFVLTAAICHYVAILIAI
ncbi:MAG: PAQR family membrane homeostasis protein TrhA [Chitinophagaceae bacterium]